MHKLPQIHDRWEATINKYFTVPNAYAILMHKLLSKKLYIYLLDFFDIQKTATKHLK